LNLRHLDLVQLAYLRAVARAGSVTAAADALAVAPQTVSGQLGVLEDRLGVELLERVGRGVRLTDAGKLVLEYATEMLSRGEDLLRALEGSAGEPTSFTIGIDEIVPKLVARRLLEPVLALDPAPRLICREGNETELLKDLRARRLDAVLVPGPPVDQTGAARHAARKLRRRRLRNACAGSPLSAAVSGEPRWRSAVVAR
jgi:LysR family transcriptional activator of nhaA